MPGIQYGEQITNKGAKGRITNTARNAKASQRLYRYPCDWQQATLLPDNYSALKKGQWMRLTSSTIQLAASQRNR